MFSRTRPCYEEQVDDARLVAALQSRDEEAFRQLVELWTPVMRRVARAHVSTDASADEVVQEAWLGVVASVILVLALPFQLAGFFGGLFAQLMWIPMAVFEVVAAVWLIVRGAAAPAGAGALNSERYLR